MPFLAAPDSDLSPYVGEYLRISKAVQLHEGRSVHGSIYRGRDTTASDELVITDLITGLFGTRALGDLLVRPAIRGTSHAAKRWSPFIEVVTASNRQRWLGESFASTCRSPGITEPRVSPARS